MNTSIFNALEVYNYLKAAGLNVKSFNSDNNTVLLNITSTECLALVQGLNFSLDIEAVLVTTCCFRLQVKSK